MNNITEITRNELFQLIINGISESIKMNYYGKISEVNFLNRIVDLKNIPSESKRFDSYYDEISTHYYFGDIQDEFWFIEDEIFHLRDGDGDEYLLKFLCQMIHPAVRDESSFWKLYLNKFNDLLKYDGYELYASDFISGREIYSYRQLSEKFIFSYKFLFTERYKKYVSFGNGNPIDDITDKIEYKVKRKLAKIMLNFREPTYVEPNRYDQLTIETDVLQLSIQKFNEYMDFPLINLNFLLYSSNLEESLAAQFTPFIFDLIEFQFHELTLLESINFKKEINNVFNDEKLDFELNTNGLIIKTEKHEILNEDIDECIKNISETGLKELLELAVQKHQKNDLQSHIEAVEKIWDAFERLKTFYKDLDKRRSSEKIVKAMSNNNAEFYRLFNDEFIALTEIGNKFTIRHYETNKINIIDSKYYDYLFNRCLSLIALAIQYLPDEGSEEDGL